MKKKVKILRKAEGTNQSKPNAIETLSDELRSVGEVQRIFQVSRRTLYNWDKSGILPARKLGGKIFYLTSDIISALTKAGRELRTTIVNEKSLDFFQIKF